MHYVYLLRCRDGSPYIGQTNNIRRRVNEHNNGRGTAYTLERRPVKLIYVEPHATRTAAVQRERQLKGWSRRKKEALIRGDLALLKALSKRRT